MLKIIIEGRGQMANRMFRYMYCRNLQKILRNSELFGYNIPKFGLNGKKISAEGKSFRTGVGHIQPMQALAKKIIDDNCEFLLFNAHVMRLEYYNDRIMCGNYFKYAEDFVDSQQDHNHITIHVRAGDIFVRPHGDYNPSPIGFFTQIIEETGLIPVFVGQFGDDIYTTKIREFFPKAIFRLGNSAIEDFQFIRNSTNILCGVSSFSWLAAWFSLTARIIHLPVSGFLNPMQRKDIDLLPTDDSRYRFYKFPTFKWQASSEQMDRVLAPDIRFPLMAAEEAAALRVPFAK